MMARDAPHSIPLHEGEAGVWTVTGAIIRAGVGGLSAPRRLTATPPEDICASVKGAGSCLRF